ncbi:MAG: class I SAM-dependent methyltransferase [Nanoarchaeota archaeon]|nr:class I SAM-dependent methyltransferase [Nanoarchaeota archaeon]
MNDVLSNSLDKEADSFDKQILERVSNGHIPDLRRSGRCEYFFNNPWRDQDFIRLYYGDLILRYISTIEKNMNKPIKNIDILEVGCGPGQVCLELARHGFNITGIDISKACIEVAEKTANEDPWKKGRGKLNYRKIDFFALREKFDIILFTASLHHFPDTDKTMVHTGDIILDNGLVIVDEPARDLVSKRNAAVIQLIKILLSSSGSYYENITIPKDEDSIRILLEKIYCSEKYETEEGVKIQSVNDNSSGFDSMYASLNANFIQVEFEKKFAFYHQMIGGIRLGSVEKERELARFLKAIDGMLCDLGAIDPTNFYFAGRKK